MNELRDRLAAANPVPDPQSYPSDKITAAVSLILSDAPQTDRELTEHKTADRAGRPVAGALSPGAPPMNRSRRRWVYPVPFAAGLATLLVFVGLPGRQDSAYAGWTAMPTGVSVPDSARVLDRCMAMSKEDFGGELSQIGDLTVVLAERRGQWTYALLANGNNVADCLQGEGASDGNGIGQASGKEVVPRPTARGITTISMVGSKFWTAYGRAGTEVATVVVNGPNGLVTATVRGGYWAAWWPANDDGAYPSFARYSLTVTLRDGTRLPTVRPWPAFNN